jgi:hypothetical protein
MDKIFCKQIDQESLVEQYVAGKLRGDLLGQFQEHLKDCENHARAVLLEKALKRGVSEFARSEIKTRLHNRLKKREDSRFMILRYAAILLVAVITPLLLYYQLNVAPEEMAESVLEVEETIIGDNAKQSNAVKLQKDTPPKTELKARRTSRSAEVEETSQPDAEAKPIQPAATGGAGAQKQEERITEVKTMSPTPLPESQKTKSAKMRDIMKATEATAPAKIESEYPLEEESQSDKTKSDVSAYRAFSQDAPYPALQTEIKIKVAEDSLAIRKCIDDYLNESEREKYKLELKMIIKNNGKIEEINIIGTTHQSVDLEDCIMNILKSWTLPKDVGEGMITQEITY